MTIKSGLLMSCAVGAVMASAAYAQTPSPASTPAAGASQDVPTIAEIVVTANKREENLQKVAGTVTAVSQAALTRQGVKEFSDISKVMPEIRVLPGAITQLTIRGIRTGTNAPGNDSPNAVHIDGVYLSRFTGLNGFFFDVQRVEALAGPQGTLYGRNSAGGTVNIITNKPTTDAFHVLGSVEYGNYNQFTVNSAVNMPLTENFALRGAYYHVSHNGYANNGLDDADTNSARVSALWRPTPNDKVLVTGDIAVLGGKGGTSTSIYQVLKSPTIVNTGGVVSIAPAGTAGGSVVPIIPATNVRDENGLVAGADAYRQDTENSGAMGQYDHDFGWATLTAQAAYRTTDTNNPSGSLTGYAQDPRLLTTGVLRPTAPGFFTQHSRWTSQEVRLASPNNREITYTLGLYHFNERSYNNTAGGYFVTYPNSGYGTSTSTIGQFLISNPLRVNANTANILGTDDAYAAFGQAVYSPTFIPGLHVTGGLRYNYEKKGGVGDTTLNGVDCSGGCFNGTAIFRKVTYKANIAYEITPRNEVYLDNSTGFKSGGFSYGIHPLYQPENITSYEIGSKNRFFDNRLQLNVSAWHYDYNNIVTTTGVPYINPQLPPPGTAVSVTAVNGNKEQVDGQSLSLIVQPTRDDSVTFNGTHLFARFTDFDIHSLFQLPIGPGGSLVYLTPGATDATYNFSGTPIGTTPDWAFSATYDHTFHVFNGDLDAELAVQYTGRRMFGMFNQISRADFNTYAAAQLAPYATADFSLRYAPDGAKWAITGYVRNMTDTVYAVQSLYNSNAALLPVSDSRVTYAYISRTYGAPRTFGIIFSFNY